MNDSSEAQRLIEAHLSWLVKRKRASEKTIKDRRRILHFADRHLPSGLLNVTEDEIHAFINQYEDPAHPTWTAYTYDTALRVFYGWASAKGYAPADPMVDLAKPIPPEPEPRPMTDEHLALLYAAPWPIPTITILGRFQGLRRCEICGLFREDVTEDRTRIRRAKGGRRQWMPTHPEVWAHLQELPVGPAIELAGGERVHPVIYSRFGRPFTPDGMSWLWCRVRNRLGLPAGIVPHHNRHRFATDVQRETHDAFLTMRALRQRQLASAKHYVGVDDEDVAAVVRSVGQAGPASDRPGLPVTG